MIHVPVLEILGELSQITPSSKWIHQSHVHVAPSCRVKPGQHHLPSSQFNLHSIREEAKKWALGCAVHAGMLRLQVHSKRHLGKRRKKMFYADVHCFHCARTSSMWPKKILFCGEEVTRVTQRCWRVFCIRGIRVLGDLQCAARGSRVFF